MYAIQHQDNRINDCQPKFPSVANMKASEVSRKTHVKHFQRFWNLQCYHKQNPMLEGMVSWKKPKMQRRNVMKQKRPVRNTFLTLRAITFQIAKFSSVESFRILKREWKQFKGSLPPTPTLETSTENMKTNQTN